MFSDMDFAQRLKTAREKAGLSQSELAAQCGLTIRSISAYETGRANPRGVTLHKLAAALGVSPAWLLSQDDRREDYIERARADYGRRGAQELTRLLEENKALFAGGDISEEAKDDFFRAIMTAYLACKEEARRTFGRQEQPHDD